MTVIAAPTTAHVAPVSSVFTPEENIGALVQAAKEAAEETKASKAGGEEATEDQPSDGTATADDKSDEQKPSSEDATGSAVSVDELRELAKTGKFEDLIAKLGIDPKGIKVPASRFAEFRIAQQRERQKIAQQSEALRAREADVQAKIADIKKQFEPLFNARQAYESGDVRGALQTAFGDDFDAIVRRAIEQQAGKDPELIALKRREEQREKEAQKRAHEEQTRAAEAARVKAETAYVERLGGELATDTDPLVAKAAKKPDFVRAVYQAQLIRYNGGKGVELTPTEAAQEVLKTIRDAHLSWSEVFGPAGGDSAESTDRGGKSPSITSPTGKASEGPAKRKGVSPMLTGTAPQKPVESMDPDELIRHFGKIMDAQSKA